MTNSRGRTLYPTVLVLLLLSTQCPAQPGAIDPSARKEINAGNQAWVDGMKQGGIPLIAATYTADALDFNAAGDCIKGRAAIEQHMKEQLTKLGRARSASVASVGSTQQGDFVYEWGQAEATFADGKKVVDRYLTVWRRQAGGGWKIFRNLVVPDDSPR